MNVMTPFLVSALLIAGSGFVSALAGDWPEFRGPENDGVAASETAPLTWSQKENVVWRTELPRPGNGSPIVVADHVFLAGSEDSKGLGRSLYCFDRATGESRWTKTIDFGKAMPTHKTNPHGSSTPAADGASKRVIVWHASAGLFCYDFDGNEIWKRDLGEFRHMWGHGGSPIIHDGKVILHCGPGERVFTTAIDLKDGSTVWETSENFDGGNAERNRAGHYRGGWSTPIVVKFDGVDTVICSMPTRVLGLDFATGRERWFCQGLEGKKGDLCYTSPVMGYGGLCLSLGGFGGPSIAFRVGGEGDITDSRRRWRSEKNPQSIGSGIFFDGHFYVPGAGPANLRCLDPKDGSVKWSDPAGKGNFWGSIVRVGKRGYVINQAGTTIVFEPSPGGYKQLASNHLGESCNTTPAVADGQIFIRTDKALYCIGKK
jgi:outer membrane protein assembly factor BamB